MSRSGTKSFTVYVYDESGVGVGYDGKSPAEAIASAAQATGADWCGQCSGTGYSRRWEGQGRPVPCELCHGTGKP